MVKKCLDIVNGEHYMLRTYNFFYSDDSLKVAELNHVKHTYHLVDIGSHKTCITVEV
jgi:hypothetical protein